MTGQKRFLIWLAEQDGYYVKDETVHEKFPNLEYNMVGVTKTVDDDGNTLTPKRDWRQAVKWGGVTD